MRKRWYVLAALAGGLTAFAIGVWPQSPLWRSGPEAGEPRGFSPDGRVLITVRTPRPDDDDNLPDPALGRWDAFTGELLSRARLRCADPKRLKHVRLSADGRIALVGEEMIRDPAPAHSKRSEWYLHDGLTGERRVGPIADLGQVSFRAFSPDGRWLCGLRGDLQETLQALLKGTRQSFQGHAIFSAETATPVLELPGEEGVGTVQCVWAADGATVALNAMHFKPKSPAARHTIRVVEVPSGRERHRFDLPSPYSVSIRNWDGRFLQVQEHTYEGDPPQTVIKVRTFDLSETPVREGVEDPLLSYRAEEVRRAEGGHDWVAHWLKVANSPPRPRWGGRFTAWLGLGRAPSNGELVTVRLLDCATGRIRYESPRPVGYPCEVTPDGRLLACRGENEGVEVWDMAPAPRWPRAALAGLAAAGGVLGLGWYRRVPVEAQSSQS